MSSQLRFKNNNSFPPQFDVNVDYQENVVLLVDKSQIRPVGLQSDVRFVTQLVDAENRPKLQFETKLNERPLGPNFSLKV